MKDKGYFVIFGGGGIRGISYCGAFKSLLENNIKLTGCAGSSIGSVFASLLAIGYSYQEIYEIISNTGFEMFIDINIDLKREIAFSKGNIFLEWIREKIEKKYYGDSYKKGEMQPVRFCDIDYNLIIFSVDLTNLKFREFSNVQTPDFEIARAVRASVSMPGLFRPLELDGSLIVDGDLLKSTPLWRVSNTIKNLDERIIEFRLEDNETSKQINSSIEYINRVYNAICGFATDYIIDLYKEKDKFDYIKINTNDVSVVDFLISKEKKKELFDIGYMNTKKYFDDYFPLKQKMLQKKYADLINLLFKFQKQFDKHRYIKAYLNLCEMFMFLCEEKRYIDKRVYETIIKLKNEYLANYHYVDFFGFQNAQLDNQEKISNILLTSLKEITQKLEEVS